MSKFDPEIIEALADAWASIDGKADRFRAGKGAASIEDELVAITLDIWPTHPS